MLAAVLALAAALPVLAAGPYPIKANGVNCRSGPSTSASVVKQYQKGQQVTLQCQTEGVSVNGNTIWGKTQDNCFVTDHYIQTTGKPEYVAPKCGGSTAPPATAEPCPTLNAAGTSLLKHFEGFVPRPAPDPIGLPTVGYGHLCQTTGCAEVPYTFPLTEATATQLLNDDVPRYTACLGDMLDGVTLNDNQWAALASWVFNLGCGATGSSSLIRRLNAGEDPATVVGQELPKWVNAGGKQLPGLVRRRNAEIDLFNTASSKQAYPQCE
ncbi:glycoside hydrolase family 24 protein [Cutaneotrichosporon oleaginosum]|uniref:Glycoside hydrolase family 24 protein n=1 Tax=Cutaneotrichosporon oleaginosum TaxID=879819 RepID=A0A0J1B3E1_9TREE|nr:glycoside hydrolase family 24 protein [Cutaneotrichosporon oleaginosum]KLT42149.1 glycoside hydrolase family 24 protein [Cutaneotrichosporon oleaginosum]TXT11726.1 hypothetical protein COLE_02136 [Cutaneotrichosporon oleaginosum]